MTVSEVLGFFSVADLVASIRRWSLRIWVSGLFLGVLFFVAVAVSRRSPEPRPLSVARATAVGSFGGLLLSMLAMTYYGRWSMDQLWSVALPLTSLGALVGIGIGRIARRPELLAYAQHDWIRWMHRTVNGIFVAVLLGWIATSLIIALDRDVATSPWTQSAGYLIAYALLAAVALSVALLVHAIAARTLAYIKRPFALFVLTLVVMVVLKRAGF